MSYFKANMHQNRCRLGCGAPPDSLAGIYGTYFKGRGRMQGQEGGIRGSREGWGVVGVEGTPVCLFKFSLE